MKAIAMGRIGTRATSPSAPCRRARRDAGFTMVEMTTSAAILVVVLSAAWMLLTVSNSNLDTIDNGGRASENNRAALAAFERDLGHAILPPDGHSPVVFANSRRCALLVDDIVEADGHVIPELVVWVADDASHKLVRSVTTAPEGVTAAGSEEEFEGGITTTSTVLTGLCPTNGSPLFTYAVSATVDTTQTAGIGLITIHLRNGMPDPTQNVVDRTASFRVIALVINGY